MLATTFNARWVLPTPPGPARVSSRQDGSCRRARISASSASRPTRGVRGTCRPARRPHLAGHMRLSSGADVLVQGRGLPVRLGAQRLHGLAAGLVLAQRGRPLPAASQQQHLVPVRFFVGRLQRQQAVESGQRPLGLRPGSMVVDQCVERLQRQVAQVLPLEQHPFFEGRRPVEVQVPPGSRRGTAPSPGQGRRARRCDGASARRDGPPDVPLKGLDVQPVGRHPVEGYFGARDDQMGGYPLSQLGQDLAQVRAGAGLGTTPTAGRPAPRGHEAGP